MDVVTLVISFLGGGVTSALIVQLFSLRVAQRTRKLELLEEQIRELYGPLFYLVSQSEKLLDLSRRFHKAYEVEFINKEYSNEPLTRERVNSWAEETIGLSNQYVKQVEANNERISELLDCKFSYIDPDDVEEFLLFYEHHVRLNTERDAGGILRTPFLIYSHIGDISYLKPGFIKRVKVKFSDKKAELGRLSKRLL